MRPTYHTPYSNRVEREGLAAYAQHVGVAVAHTPDFTPWDGETNIAGNTVLIEYKRRSYPLSFFRWNPLMLSHKKVKAMAATGHAGIVLLGADDGLMAFDAYEHTPPTPGGRTDRNDPLDIELVVHYPHMLGHLIREW